MTGPCVASDWDGESELFYVTKNTSGILVLPDQQYEEQPCIRCTRCESVCPAGLIPYQIEFALMDEDYDLCEKLYASECIAVSYTHLDVYKRQAIILVTHNIGLVRVMADQILVLKDGKTIEYGSRERVLNHPEEEYTKQLMASVPHLRRSAEKKKR